MKHFPHNLAEAIDWLSLYGAEADGGVTRTLYSKSWKEAQEALKEWMEQLGLETRYDAIGNLFGRLPARQPSAPTILVGSHIDTVKSGGKYDGAYGVLAGILALDYLKRNYGEPAINLEIVSLCEEEGSRFPLTCWGSGMMTGVYSFADSHVLDADGVTFQDAMKEAGFALANQEYIVPNNILSFVELHIEQGPCLEKSDKEIGIVQTIVGQKRYRITVKGKSNHAGTTLMKWRKDPVHGAVSMIYELHEFVHDYDEDLVATVGQIFIEPNVSNVIAQQVVFTVDVRHPLESVLTAFCERFFKRFQEVSDGRGLELTIETYHQVTPVQLDVKLNELAQTICEERNISYHLMNSGAGHDAQLFAKVCQTALLFVPSQGGVSHSPLEYTSPKALETGLQVLTDILHHLAYNELGGGEK